MFLGHIIALQQIQHLKETEVFSTQLPISANIPVLRVRVKPLRIENKNRGRGCCFLHAYLCIFLDHAKCGKCTTIFNQTFTKTLTFLRVNKNFGGNYVYRFYLMTSRCGHLFDIGSTLI